MRSYNWIFSLGLAFFVVYLFCLFYGAGHGEWWNLLFIGVLVCGIIFLREGVLNGFYKQMYRPAFLCLGSVCFVLALYVFSLFLLGKGEIWAIVPVLGYGMVTFIHAVSVMRKRGALSWGDWCESFFVALGAVVVFCGMMLLPFFYMF